MERMVLIAVMVTERARSPLNTEQNLQDTKREFENSACSIYIGAQDIFDIRTRIPQGLRRVYLPVAVRSSWTARHDQQSNANAGIEIQRLDNQKAQHG
jgi:precorrin-4 methylase